MDKEYKINNEDAARLIAFGQKNKYAGAHRPLTFAAILLGRKNFEALSLFYTLFCYCDDEIDQIQTKEIAEAKLDTFKAFYTRIVNRDRIKFEESAPFAGLQYAMEKYQVPFFYFKNLLTSNEMDVHNQTYPAFNDLITYCYLATSLGMAAYSYVTGVNNEEGVHYAMYYGISSQLTNTARDILVDAKIGRIYVPLEWLNEYNIPQHDITNSLYSEQVHHMAERIAKLAETYRQQGDHCLPFFSFSAACTLSLARQLDTAICQAICSQGTRRWEQGITIPWWKKILLVPIAITRVMRAQRTKIFKKFKPLPIHKIWRQDEIID